TERQFLDLLGDAAGDTVVCLRLYSIPEVPRTDWGRALLNSRYLDVGHLRNSGLDAVIITGTEPRATDLRDEPYWATLTRVFDWAEQNTVASVYSCLAAHAAVLHTDGIRRRRLPDKRFGVFDHWVATGHPLTRGAPRKIWNPHSRWNELPLESLVAAGYQVLTRSDEAGVDLFVKQGNSLSVF